MQPRDFWVRSILGRYIERAVGTSNCTSHTSAMPIWSRLRATESGANTSGQSRTGSDTHVCIDMCIDMCTDICTGMCMDMRIDMCTDMCLDMCIDMCADIHTDMCMGRCIGRCIGMCVGMCVDVRIDACIQTYAQACSQARPQASLNLKRLTSGCNKHAIANTEPI